jgi:eukaryotic-like serine/threonine-protein kinase
MDRYTFKHELGCGGMATVYLASDPAGCSVPIKVLRPDLVPILGAERFAREIQIASGLKHPSILPVLDSGQARGLPFYVTPYIRGESLAQRLKREAQLSVEDAIDITCQIAEALEVAHAQGFVHRVGDCAGIPADMSPEQSALAAGAAFRGGSEASGEANDGQKPAPGLHGPVEAFALPFSGVLPRRDALVCGGRLGSRRPLAPQLE